MPAPVPRISGSVKAGPTKVKSFLNTDRGKDYTFVGPAFTDPDILGTGAGIAVRKDETQLLDSFNKALRQIRADGTFKQINDKYFAFDISAPP